MFETLQPHVRPAADAFRGVPAALILHSGLVAGLLAASLLAIPPIPHPVRLGIPPYQVDVVLNGGGPAGEAEPPPPARSGLQDGRRDRDEAPPSEPAPEASPPEEEAPVSSWEETLFEPASDPLESPADRTRPAVSGTGGGGTDDRYGDPLGADQGSVFGVLGGTGRGGGDGSGVGGSRVGRGGEPERIFDGNLHVPRLIAKIEPIYPRQAIMIRREGTVTLRIVVDTDGSVRNVTLIRSDPLFDRAATEAIRQWRYEPARIDGRPVAVSLTVEVSFVLR